MCRLFALHAGHNPANASFWLLDAPDSLVAQSRLQPDGVGLGWFDAIGEPHLDKRPVAAYEDELFAAEARRIKSSTVIAHIRHASTGSLRFRNTHPFLQGDLMFAHNGVVEGLNLLEDEIGPSYLERYVHGDTDSERVFALITQRIERANGENPWDEIGTAHDAVKARLKK